MTQPKKPAERPTPSKGGGFKLLITNSEFRKLWSASMISLVGSSFQWLAVVLAISELTNRNLTIIAWGLTALAIPSLVGSFFGGPLLDRLSLKRLMIGLDLARVGTTVCCALAYQSGNLTAFFIALSVQGLIGSLFGPAQQALTPRLLSHEQLFSSNAINGLGFLLSMAVGPAIAGLVIGQIGLEYAFYCNGLSFFLSALIILTMKPTTPGLADGKKKPVLGDLLEGLRFIFGHRLLRAVLMVINLPFRSFQGLTLTIYIPYLQQAFNASPGQISQVQTALGVGMLLGGIIAGSGVLRGRSDQSIFLVGVVGWSLGSVAKGLAPGYRYFMPINVVQGACGIPAAAAVQTLFQKTAPKQMIGRMMASVYNILQAAYMLGMTAAPVLGKAVGMDGAFIVAGGVCVFGALLTLLLIRNYRPDAGT